MMAARDRPPVAVVKPTLVTLVSETIGLQLFCVVVPFVLEFQLCF